MRTLADAFTRNLLLDGSNASRFVPEAIDGTPEGLRAALHRYFDVTFSLFERLFESFASDDTFYVQPEPLRHPHLFYFGHTATFYVNKLHVAGLIPERLNPQFESMFAIGVDEMSWDDLNSEHYDWPPVQAVRDYRTRTRTLVHEVIDRIPIELPVTWSSPAWAILMGIEHERIHLETSSVLIRQTPLSYLKPEGDPIHAFWQRCIQTGPAPGNGLLPVPGGRVRLGKAHAGDRQYGWDNEYGQHEADVEPFLASRMLVSNGEYLEFVQAGGYRENRWWGEEGRRWLEYRSQRGLGEHPVFWRRGDDGQWRYRTLLAEIDLPYDWPVDVNYLEAKAYCNWKATQTGKPIRLPTEDEYYRLCEHCGLADEPEWGPRGGAPGNINLEYGASACAVNRFEGRHGFCDVVGNAWQWTETPIDGFTGFEVHPWYDDFSTPTFDDKHNLIKGGSWISTGNEANRASRYAFRRHFFQHAGFRYVEAGPNPFAGRIEASNRNLYETDRQLSQYCEFHYGAEYFAVPNFPRACAEIGLRASRQHGRALDLGCATGRASFELARGFEFVQGIDLTARFTRLAQRIKDDGRIDWEINTEGDLTEHRHIELADLGLSETAARVEFWQGDAGNLKPHFSGYDLILAANLIDRMRHPADLLRHIHERLNPQGVLVLASPYTWLPEFSDREEWLGGFERDGRQFFGLDGLKAVLLPQFELVQTHDVPFVLRETARKFQHTVSEVSVWRLRPTP